MKHFSEGNQDSNFCCSVSFGLNVDQLKKSTFKPKETEQQKLERKVKQIIEDFDNNPKLLQEFNYQLRKRKIEQFRNKKII